MRTYLVERVGSNAASQSGIYREIVGTVEAPTARACWALEYPSLPGTEYATTAITLEDGSVAHCYHNQHFEYRSFLRASKADRARALGWEEDE